jgi:fatty-acyl-CoA synthase
VTNNDWSGITIGQLLHYAVERFGDKSAYVFDDGERVSFRLLAERVERTARGLLAIGVQPGDRVAMWLQNTPEWVYTYLAVATIGAALVPVNTALRTDEAAYVIGHSDASVLVVGRQLRDRDLLEQARLVLADDRVSVRTLVVVGGEDVPDAITMAELIKRGEEVLSERVLAASAVQNDAVVLLLYTSGTTGFPKGAMHSHNILRNVSDAAERMRLGVDDVVVLYLPFFHIFAASSVLAFLMTGGTIVLMESFDAARSLELMERERATVAYGVGTMFYDQLHHESLPDRDLSSLRLCLSPGAPALVRELDAAMGPTINGYGMTETSAFTALPRPEDDLDHRADTVGLPLPGFELRIVDASGAPVSTGTTGELIVRGHPVMLGYYKNPEASAAALDAGGWFRTGDLAALTEDGYLRFMGRSKDMIRVAGENVDPLQVEAVLMGHPAVALAAVVGLPHERLGEVPAAYVQLRAGASVAPDALVRHVEARLAKFKVPRRLEVVRDFPTTGSGKIQKFRIRDEMARTRPS